MERIEGRGAIAGAIVPIVGNRARFASLERGKGFQKRQRGGKPIR